MEDYRIGVEKDERTKLASTAKYCGLSLPKGQATVTEDRSEELNELRGRASTVDPWREVNQ
jgi:hypothetical protein